MPSPCRITQLSDRHDTYTDAMRDLEHTIAAAIADSVVTTSEVQSILSRLAVTTGLRTSIGGELSIVKDGAEMIRTLATTFAITPKTSRKLREKSADYLTLVVNNDGPSAA